MKKIAVILLAFVLLFSFCACKNEEGDNGDVSSQDLAYNLDSALAEGSIPELPYKLGTDIEQIKKDANYNPDTDVHDHDEALTITENTNNIRLSYLTSYYYYEPEKVEKGVSSIVDFGTPFGLEVGTATPDEVTAQFEGISFETRELTSKQVYFIPMEMNDCTALTYSKDNRRIDFIFENDVLIAVNLTDTENWSIIK